MTKLLLDSVALIWWFTGNPKFSKPVRRYIENGEYQVYVSAASAWEIATKVRQGKMPEAISLIAHFDDFLAEQDFIPLGITMTHARLGGSLASAHKDPFDRLIAAQAQIEDMPVVTCDAAFQGLGVRILW
jgi:PIN domain nuclease of toxin-antitoxin system